MAGRVTLDELYVLVPSAEEYDLAEEAELDRLHAWLVKEYAALLDPPDDDPLPGVPSGADASGTDAAGTGAAHERADGGDADQPEWRPSDAQALGCLEHLLGAEIVPPEPETPATTPTPPRHPDGTAEGPAG
jgi:hypothetical protein